MSWRQWLLVSEFLLFVGHLVLVTNELAHWEKMRTDNQRLIAVNTLALLSFHFCIVTPLFLLSPNPKTRLSFAVTAMAWVYALVIGLFTALVFKAPFFVVVLISLTILQSFIAFILILWED
jgi:hypothetical protein